MSHRRIDLERIAINLHGVDAELAAAAVDGLDVELRRRLGKIPLTQLRADTDLSLRLNSAQLPPDIDAAGLRSLIAGRLIDGLRQGGR